MKAPVPVAFGARAGREWQNISDAGPHDNQTGKTQMPTHVICSCG